MRVHDGGPRSASILRRGAAAALGCLLLASVPHAQQPPPPSSPVAPAPDELRFEVISVKKSAPDSWAIGSGQRPGGRFEATGMPAAMLVTMAYGLPLYRVIGLPDWARSERFDIKAVGPDISPPRGSTPPQPGSPELAAANERRQQLIRSLLAERFGFVAHRETREMAVYNLVMARDDRRPGERLRPTALDCQQIRAERARGGRPFRPPRPGEFPECMMFSGMGRIGAGGMPLANLASMLGGMLNRPVNERTGLTGDFDFIMEFTPDSSLMSQLPLPSPPAVLSPGGAGPPSGATPLGGATPPGPLAPLPDAPPLMTALREQLGLKLESAREPVEIVVVDTMTPPDPD